MARATNHPESLPVTADERRSQAAFPESLTACVLGLGHVGLVQAACLADDGHDVIGVDRDPERAAAVARGECPVSEPGLGAVLERAVASGRLRTAGALREAVPACDVTLVCLGTPSAPDGRADLSALLEGIDELARVLDGLDRSHAVIVRSTIAPGTMRGEVLPRLRGPAGSLVDACLHLPEFLREGCALDDYRAPRRIVVGCENGHENRPEVAGLVERLFARQNAPRHFVALETAELAKFTDNFWHALKVCFANEVGALADAMAIDGQQVMQIFGEDRTLNISTAYLRPGMPFGGSCLPKDVSALRQAAIDRGLSLPVLDAVLPSNERQLDRCVRRVQAAGAGTIGLWGIAFKPGTSDLRGSPALELAARLVAQGRQVRAHDGQLAPAMLAARIRQERPDLAPALDAGLLRATQARETQACDILVACHPLVPAGLPESTRLVRLHRSLTH